MDVYEIIGSKGKGGGGRAAKEEPNTLRSAAIVRVVEVLSEGEIEGICGGPKGIYINDTPMMASDGSWNFPRAAYSTRVGLPNQDYMPGFADVESETVVGSAITIGSPVTRTTTSAAIDVAKVTIQLPQGLYSQNTSNGDLKGTEVSFTIETKLTSSGSWANAQTFLIKGKTTSAYEAQFRIARPAGAGTWDVRVTRVTADSAVASLRNATTFARITEVQEIKDETTEYNNTAVVGLAIDAETVGGQIPNRSYLIKGLKVKIPSNYNPTTRAYTGIWNGTFNIAWTDNPAWVLYDLISHERYGLGEFVDEDQIDKYSFYDAAVYNDELVPDGSGGSEPRFTTNFVLNTRDQAFKIFQTVAGGMRGSLAYFNGLVTLLQDRPADPVRLITKANVIDGKFTRKSTGLFDRHTAFNVTFNDRKDRHLQRVTTIDAATQSGAFGTQLAAAQAKYGYNPVDIAAFGATTEGQALRHGRWAVDTELNQTELISFKMSLNGFDLLPNDIVSVYDEDYTLVAGGGRIVSVVGTTVTIDRPVTLTVGSKIQLMLADGLTLEERNIVQTSGTVSSFTISSAFSTAAIEQSDFVVTTTVPAQQFKIIGIKQEETNVIGVEAVSHDPNKYARVEDGISVPVPKFSNAIRATTSAPTNLTFRESAHTVDNTIRRSLLVSWGAPTSGTASYYVITWRREGSTWTTIDRHGSLSFELVNGQVGEYDINVYAVSSYGNQSAPVSGTYTIFESNGGSSDLNAPTTLVERNGGGTAFNNVDLSVIWTNPASNGLITTDTLRDFQVKVLTTSDVVLRTEYIAGVPPSSTQTYTYSFEKNNSDTNNVPNRSVKIEVRCRDTSGDFSSAVSTTFTNPAPASPSSLSVDGGIGNVFVTYNLPNLPDWKGTLVWMSTTNGFTPSSGNLVYDGSDSVLTLKQLGSGIHYLRVAHYDTFGKSDAGTGLNLSAQQSTTPLATAGIPNGSSLPGSGTEADLFYNTTDGKLYRYHSGAWTVATDGADIIANSITGGKILASAIEGYHVAANTIAANNMVANTLTASQMSTSMMSSDNTMTRGLTVRDGSGNVILSSGVPLTATYITPATNWVNNLMDYSWWKDGADPTTNGWNANNFASGGSNTLGQYPGPSGHTETLWYARAGTGADGSQPSGGWNAGNTGSGYGNWFKVDINKSYRFCIVFRHTTVTPSGTAWWGIQSYDVCNLNTTTPNWNPYFKGSFAPPVAGRWYMAVGYVYPYGTTGNTHDGAGVYDLTTGVQVDTGTNYNWASGVTHTGTRAYQHYSNTNSVMLFCRPMVHLVDGGEPTIDALLASGSISARNPITASTASTYIASAAIGTAQIANAAIGTAQIGDLTVSNAKIANGAITNAKIGSAAVDTAQIANAAVGTAQIGDANITTLKIAGEAVTVPRLYTGSDQSSINSSWTTLVSQSINPSGGATGGFIITGAFYAAPASGVDVYGEARITIGGTVVVTQKFGIRGQGGASVNFIMPVTLTVAANGISGATTVSLESRAIAHPGGSTNPHSATSITLSVMSGKR